MADHTCSVAALTVSMDMQVHMHCTLLPKPSSVLSVPRHMLTLGASGLGSKCHIHVNKHPVLRRLRQRSTNFSNRVLARLDTHERGNFVLGHCPTRNAHFWGGFLPRLTIHTCKNPFFLTRPTRNARFGAGFLGACTFLKNLNKFSIS